MSLTLPTAYSASSKLSNIQENWIVQLGFFNGDAQGSGEGGWNAMLQADGTANLINLLGSELVQDGDNPDHRVATWTMRDSAGNSDGWGSGAPSPYSDDETASMINTLTGNDVDAGLHYSLTFTVGVATLSLVIGGGDLTGNTADETFVAKASYAAGTHTVTFTATADRSHLWFTADTSSAGNGTLDDVTLKRSGYGTAETSIIVDDGTVFQAGDYIKIESEIMKVKSISTHTLTVARGAMSTTAVGHSNNTALYWNNFTPISLADTTIDDVFYHGTITNKPSIRSSISLSNSTAKIGNTSLSIVNFNYKNDDFSAELLSGTRTYLNQDVRIYVQLNGSSNLSDCLHIYTGRLHGINHGDKSIGLSIKSYSPWDRMDYPSTYSVEKVLAPLSFGGFAGNDSTYTGTGTDNWRPVPFTKVAPGHAFFTTGVTADSSFSKTSQYVPTRDGFVPFTTSSTSTTTTGSVETITVGINGKYKFYTTPTSDSQTVSETGWTETNIAQSYNLNTGDSGLFAYDETFNGAGQTRVHTQRYVIPETEESVQIVLTYTITSYLKGTNVSTFTIKPTLATATDTINGTEHSANAGSTVLTLVTTDTTTYVDLTITTEAEEAEDEDAEQARAYLNAFEISVTNIRNEDKLEEVYTDVGSEVKNYTSGAVANIHEAHRSLLHGALGLTETPTNWSALDTERTGSPSAWTILYWQNKQMPIKKILDLLQYEGQFIYVYERGAGKYIFIADSPSSIATITQDDISKFSINEVNFDELETKHVIDYDPHPAKSGEYRSQATQTSGNRDDYNFATNENIITVPLEALAASVSGGSDRNDDWATYRQKLYGAIRLTVQFDLINPAFSNIEIGDIIDFGTMPVDPGGGAWSGKNFIIIKTSRSPGLLRIIAREVG
tara:strand:- start:797 stop:3484 length:2688 start_codon:yes stop_codon:yes gene_type:complete